MMEEIIRIEIYNKDELLETKEFDICSWYDADVDVIDYDEPRKERGITKIKGEEFDEFGNLSAAWCNHYDNEGRLDKSEQFDI